MREMLRRGIGDWRAASEQMMLRGPWGAGFGASMTDVLVKESIWRERGEGHGDTELG